MKPLRSRVQITWFIINEIQTCSLDHQSKSLPQGLPSRCNVRASCRKQAGEVWGSREQVRPFNPAHNYNLLPMCFWFLKKVTSLLKLCLLLPFLYLWPELLTERI